MKSRKVAAIELSNGDLVRLVTGGGGGYGDPLERDPELVAQDVKNGYVTKKEAYEKYGVVFKQGKLTVDYERTKKLRERLRDKRSKK